MWQLPRKRADGSRRTARQVNCAACAIPAARSSSRCSSAVRMPTAIASGSSGSTRTAASPAGFVHRRVRGHDDGHAARHRLHDRHPEPLETRRIDERGGATHQPGHLALGDEPELDDPRVVEQRLIAPAGAARDRERQLAAQRPPRLHQRLEVLARLERGEAEHVRPAELGTFAVRLCTRRHARRGDADPLARHAQVLLHIAAGVGRVDEDEVAFCGARELVAVHRACARCHPLRMQERHEVVHHRRPDPTPLRRHHPVAEMEDVDRRRGNARRDGRPRRLQPILKACDHGKTTVRTSTGTSASASRINLRPLGRVGANAISSCLPAAASARPASEPWT